MATVVPARLRLRWKGRIIRAATSEEAEAAHRVSPMKFVPLATLSLQAPESPSPSARLLEPAGSDSPPEPAGSLFEEPKPRKRRSAKASDEEQ